MKQSSSNARATEVEAVARAFLRHVRENGRGGTWVRGIAAFKAALDECRALEWVRYIEENPKARSAITSVIERLMEKEFADIEKDKRGTARSAPVFYRVRPGGGR
jgi:hypothetical protein